jgi:hypothetical protein
LRLSEALSIWSITVWRSAEPPEAKSVAAESAALSWLFSCPNASLRESRKPFPGAFPPVVPSTAPVPFTVLAPDSAETPLVP